MLICYIQKEPKICFWLNEVKGIRFTFLSETTKKLDTYLKQSFSDIDISNNMTVILERGETNKVCFSAYCLDRISRLWCRRGSQVEPSSLVELRRQIQESREAKPTSSHRTKYRRGERCTEAKFWRCAEDPPQICWALLSVCVQGNYKRGRKKHLKGEEGKISGTYSGPVIVCIHTR